MSQSILVLGASGYIGQHLVRELSARGYPVLAAARHIDRLQKLDLPGVTLPRYRPQSAAGSPGTASRGRYPLLSGAWHGRRRRFHRP